MHVNTGKKRMKITLQIEQCILKAAVKCTIAPSQYKAWFSENETH